MTKLDDQEIILSGRFVKIARFKEEWDIDVNNPQEIVDQIRKAGISADIYTFMQRLPYSKPNFNYFLEWDNAAALPITTYENWFKNQLHQNPRNKLRIAQKKGVILKYCEFNDELIQGITEIYNEAPFRQGKKFPDYGITFEETRKGHATFLDRATFIGAYFEDELIGFIKVVSTDRYARTMGILAKVAHRDKAPMNLLIAKAVELCAERKYPYLVYGKYTYGKIGSDTLQEFKRYLGFESITLPRYYIPVNAKGRLALKLNLHEGIVGLMPRKLIRTLLALRSRWYSRKTESNP